MRPSTHTIAVVSVLVVTATLLPMAGLAATAPAADAQPTDSTAAEPVRPENDTTVRLHRVPADTEPTDLPDHVGVDGPGDPVFVPGDRLVVSVRSQELAADLANASGSTLTDRFAATQRDGSRLRLVQTNPTVEREPVAFDLTDAANVTVVDGDGAATYHVVVDTEAVVMGYGSPGDDDFGESVPDLGPEMEFYAGFDGHDWTAETPNRTIEVADTDVTVPTDPGDGTLRLEPGTNVSVAGRTTLPPGTSVTVTLDGPSGGPVASDVTAVERTDEGDAVAFRFTASLDLPDATGEGYSLRVVSNGTTLAESVPVTVVPREASLTVENDTTRWGTRIEHVNLTHGGFVVLRVGGVDGPILGVSDYETADRRDSNVQFRDAVENRTTVVAVAYRDVNHNGEFDDADEPYRENGTPVTATAVVRPAQETVVDTPATTATPTTAATVVTHTTTTRTLGMADPGDTDDDGSVPGFGVSGTLAALLGLCSLVMLRRR